jgi:molybdate transport system substrate-binding protein
MKLIKLTVFLLFITCQAVSCKTQAVELTVSAAASLKNSMLQAAEVFEKEYPDVKINFNFASSHQLEQQIQQGAPVDLFASADAQHTQLLVAQNKANLPVVLARNQLTIIAAKFSSIKKSADLAQPKVRIIMATHKTPITQYTHQLLKNLNSIHGDNYKASVLNNKISEEIDVRMITLKIALGAGDAGIVYASDITPDLKNKIKIIPIEEPLNVMATYSMVLISNSQKLPQTQQFYNFLLSRSGQAILIKNGFLPEK